MSVMNRASLTAGRSQSAATAYPDRVIDMRHFLYVGSRKFPELQGLLIEIHQWSAAKLESDPERRELLSGTAFDPQDFYSNALGKEFFTDYDPHGPPFGEQLRAYFRRREAQHR